MSNPIIAWISYIISCTFEVYVIYGFMDDMYQTKLPKMKRIISYIVFVSLWLYINSLSNPIYNISYFVICVFAIWFFIYKQRELKEVIHIIILIITFAGCDTLISSLFSIITGYLPIYENQSIFFLPDVVMIQVILLGAKELLVYIFKQSTYNLYLRQTILFSIIPILNIAIIYIIAVIATYQYSEGISYFIITLLSIFSVIVNFAIIYLFKNILKSNQLERDYSLMKQQLDMQYKFYQQLEIDYNNSQKVTHDIKNHLSVIETLFKANQVDEGLEYSKKLTNIIENLSMKFKSNNQILNIIINEKIKICNLNHIEFIYSVENLDLSFMENIDITAIFANLFDNAIEACSRISTDKKQIELRIYKFNNMLIINLINTIDNAPKTIDGKFVSSKKSHSAVGLSNVEASVKKYDGDICISVEPDKFSVSIMFPPA
ncbi:ATP-binding protein [Caproiciproducens sp. NJN-50]|nr:ATP-binding protein [Caproiciproducens sp. NJN-50]